MDEIAVLFPASYESSRARFRENHARVQAYWPDARLGSHRLEGEDDLTIDWIWAEAPQRTKRMLILTAGEHGVETFVGSAMHQLFFKRYLPRLDPRSTGLLVVHTINPWGMVHLRRTNAHNVDLNRNFLLDPQEFDPAFNPAYAELDAFLNPNRPATAGWLSLAGFLWRFLRILVRIGSRSFWERKRLGQYGYPRGLHYGGTSIQEETEVLLQLFRDAFERAPQILHLDMHTGYGPRFQMSLVNSALERRSSEEWVRRLGYPRVLAATGGEFYAMRGDMIDCIYALRDREYPDHRLYATAFEFGTLGHHFLAQVRDLRAMVRENQMHWHGAEKAGIRQDVQQEFLRLFAPSAARWRAKAVADADQAFRGILAAEGFIAPGDSAQVTP